MLPLIPALILLLLQGPSNFERLAQDGRLHQALDAVQRQSNLPNGIPLKEEEAEAVLASMLSAASDPQLSQAILHLLTMTTAKPSRPSLVLPVEEPVQAWVPTPDSGPPLPEGRQRGSRTRDGPF